MSDQVTLTIDGKEVTVPRGTKVIEAAKQVGVEIPHFCYHPGLPVDGNCRMCIADVRTWNARAEKHFPARRPAVTCWTDAEENMQVFTDTDEVKKSRATVMEFLLINHPIDCPICDKAGECMLQDHYMQHDGKRSELREEKIHKPRLKPFGERIVYNGERCILCSRCTRFTAHVSKTHDLGIVNRGDRAVVELAQGSTFDNAYTDNVSDICPVGALTKTDFRFKKRVWFLKHTDSVCGGCSRNCNTVVDHDRAEIVRIMPRRRDEVNGHFMCNEGRDIYKSLAATVRTSAPISRVDELGAGPSWDDALAWAGGKLGEQKKGGKLAVIGSPWMSNEEALVLGHLAGKVCKSAWMDIKNDVIEGYPADDLLHTDDHNPNRAGVIAAGVVPGKKDGKDLAAIQEAIAAGEVEVLLVWGTGLANHYDSVEAMHEAVAKVPVVIQLTDAMDALSEVAQLVLPVRNWAERDGTWTNFEGHTSRFRKALRPHGQARDGFELLSAMCTAAGGKPPVKTFKDARKKLKQDPDSDVREVADGEFAFYKGQSLYRHHSGTTEV
ncbi:MAG: (2Fe-2S)-binding protein [Deltaproteobacteria bacterium]|nr:(2Fe-2S)-binding protein [Deltaproteobacteria bacterium]